MHRATAWTPTGMPPLAIRGVASRVTVSASADHAVYDAQLAVHQTLPDIANTTSQQVHVGIWPGCGTWVTRGRAEQAVQCKTPRHLRRLPPPCASAR